MNHVSNLKGIQNTHNSDQNTPGGIGVQPLLTTTTHSLLLLWARMQRTLSRRLISLTENKGVTQLYRGSWMITSVSGRMSYMRGHDSMPGAMQQAGESVEQYILTLYSLIQDCYYSQEQKEQGYVTDLSLKFKTRNSRNACKWTWNCL